MATNVRSWVEGGRGFIEARFRADEGGVRQARETEQKLALDGFTVIDVHQKGGHLNAGRSIASSLVGLSLLKATGFGAARAATAAWLVDPSRPVPVGLARVRLRHFPLESHRLTTPDASYYPIYFV